MVTFDGYFRKATGRDPFPYQRALAMAPAFPDVLEAPTGAGKTAAAILGWVWRRRYAGLDIRARTPRRLVYCLPLRSLVTQTADAARQWIAKAADPVPVHVLMGGEVDEAWEMDPTGDLVLVGTQDQLLSRALNRGYSMSRFRWPVHYALLNNDALWILDETQLMGPGLSTSAQLAGLRKKFGAHGPVHTMWMSATLDRSKLATIDFRDTELKHLSTTEEDAENIHLHRRLTAAKRLVACDVRIQKDADPATARSLAQYIVEHHRADTRTLVVVNRVKRAQLLYEALLKTKMPSVELLHSRFRKSDRAPVEARVFDPSWSGVLIATQVVEAGVDISARLLVSELAPWSSLVQRFGRCNRYGEVDDAIVAWVDVDEAQTALPYEAEDLCHARDILVGLPDAGIKSVFSIKIAGSGPALPVIRRRDVLELFETQPDLSGADIDVSRYVRATDDRDVSVCWRNWEVAGPPPAHTARPQHHELCNVPVGAIREFLKKTGAIAYRWNAQLERWQRAEPLVPGMNIILPCSAGGYSAVLGWTGDPKQIPADVSQAAEPPEADSTPEESGQPETLDEHTIAVYEKLASIVSECALDPSVARTALDAARWHDRGKAVRHFQAMLKALLPDGDPARARMLAKSGSRSRPTVEQISLAMDGGTPRRFYRHELASALALMHAGGDDLAAYLVAAHHGRIRTVIRSRPAEPRPHNEARFALGVWDGDELLETDLGHGFVAPAVRIDLSIAGIGGSGESGGWTERALQLLEQHGPYRLSFYEALLRIADWRASAGVTAEVSDA